MAMEADEAQVQAVHCFAATFRHPTTNDARSGILRVNSLNQALELFTIEGLVLSISASNIICFQFDVRNPETQFTIYRRNHIPVDIQTASSDDSDQICVLLDALIASRPIAPNCKFLRSGQADLCGRTVTLILLGNAHIIFADGSIPILLINLAHTKISLSRKTGITLTLLKGPEQEYLLDMKTERERQEWVVAFNRAMAIRKAPPGRLSVAQHRGPVALISPGALHSQRGSFQASIAAPMDSNKKDPMVDRHHAITAKQEKCTKDQELGLTSDMKMTASSSPQRRDSFLKDDDKVNVNSQVVPALSAGHSSKRPSLSQDDDKPDINQRPHPSPTVVANTPDANLVPSSSNNNNIAADKKSEPANNQCRSITDHCDHHHSWHRSQFR